MDAHQPSCSVVLQRRDAGPPGDEAHSAVPRVTRLCSCHPSQSIPSLFQRSDFNDFSLCYLLAEHPKIIVELAQAEKKFTCSNTHAIPRGSGCCQDRAAAAEGEGPTVSSTRGQESGRALLSLARTGPHLAGEM